MWRLFGKVLTRSLNTKTTKLLTMLTLGTSLSYMVSTHPSFSLSSLQTPSSPSFSPCQRNILKVPSTFTQSQLQQLSQIFPQYSIQLSSKLTDKICCINSSGECREIQIDNNALIDRDWIHQLGNFAAPPHQIDEEKWKKLVYGTTGSQNVILRYIPLLDERKKGQEEELMRRQKEYRELKYQSTSTNNTYVVVRDQQLANKFGINENNLYILKPKLSTSQKEQQKHQSQIITLNNEQFYVTSIDSSQNISTQKQFVISNTLEDLNIIYNENQLDNFIRTVKNSSSKLVLAVGLDKVNGKDFEEVKKAFKKFKIEIGQDVHVLINKNKGLLKRRLNIEEDPSTIETRLLDLDNYQAPKKIFEGYTLKGIELSKESKVISRRKYEQSLDKNQFLKFLRQNKQQYYENKQLKNIQPITKLTKDLRGVVLIYKNECHGCMLVGRVLQNIQQIADELKREGESSAELIKNNKILCPEKFKDLQLYRYHILNEDSEYPLQVNYTPQIHFLSEKGDRLIKLKDEAKIKDVHLNIIKDICEEIC